MDTTTVISDLLDNVNFDANLGSLSQMAQDFEYQILMQELQEELNS